MPAHVHRGTTRGANVLPVTVVSTVLAVAVLLASYCWTAAAASSLPQLDVLAVRLSATAAWQAVSQKAEQQRLCRLSALMQELRTAKSLLEIGAQLTLYAAKQRPAFAAKDVLQLLEASARADAAADAAEPPEESGLQYIGDSLFDFSHSRTSSSFEQLSDLFVMAPDGDGPLLLHALSEHPSTYDLLVDVAASGVPSPPDCYGVAVDGATSHGLSTHMHGNKQQPLQLNVAISTSLKPTSTAQFAAADLLFAEELVSPSALQQLTQQSIPIASRRARKLLKATGDRSRGSSTEDGFPWLIDGTFVTGLAGHDGNLIAIEDLIAAMPSELLSAGASSKVALPQVASMQREQQDYRIIGGVEAPKDRYKWMCSLRGNNDFHFCGCSLIAPSVVLTAAHCLDQADTALSTPWVEIGRYFLTGANETANDYDRFKCTKSVVHPGWSFDTGLNDVALCFLGGESRFAPVTLVKEDATPKDGTPVTVMGWGAQAEDGSSAAKLMQVEVNVVPLDTCSKVYQGAIKETQLCAGVPEGGRDACQGDSGGPLILPGQEATDADVQVGIVSYGVGCGRPNIPGVYTNVGKYRNYITEQLLANGISYSPVTGNGTALTPSTAATPATPSVVASGSSGSSSDPQCACSSNGYSSSTFVGQTLTGCKQHGLDFGDKSFYCYAVGGVDCTAATASNAYPGAAWLNCDPESQPKSKVTSAVAPTSSTGSAGSDSVALSSLLQSLQSWISFNAMSNSTNSTAANNSVTQVVAAGGGNSSSPRTAVRDAIRRVAIRVGSGR